MILKIIKIIFGLLFVGLIIFYGCLWLLSNKQYPVEYGISFSRFHAQSLGLDWQKVYLTMLDELKPKYIRLAATWSETEAEKNKFDFTAVDWQMNEAKKRGVKVLLVVGQKAPRWPECHVPEWSKKENNSEYSRSLFNYVKTVVERYQKNTALYMWQVENEPFIKFRFGECEHYDSTLVNDEINLVRSLDKNHKILITDSGELSTWQDSAKAGDLLGTTIYRIVRTPGGRIWKYDWLPAAFYRLKAEFWGVKLENFIVAELQAEPWFASSGPSNTDLEEQAKTMNLGRLENHFNYTEKIGVSQAYLWGVEWWYWMREVKNDASYWELVKTRIGS